MSDGAPISSSLRPLLPTKTMPPRPRAGRALVARPRLLARLNDGLTRKLTLVSAPAGFGKTTLVADWLRQLPSAETPLHIGWLSLDSDDNDLHHFGSYLVAAHDHIPAIGDRTQGLLTRPEPPSPKLLVASWLEDISAVDGTFILVLDDYHFIEEEGHFEGLAYALDYLPPSAHLVLISRSDPPIPLPRWRVRDELVELRAADLRFTAEEAAQFLTDHMGLSLSAEDVATLEARTEGWIAGLQMAALSLQGRGTEALSAEQFTGGHRFVFDYLATEVVDNLPPATRQFLLQTSILARLSPDLCDAVTQQTNASEQLAFLEQANLFVTALDDQQAWYRVHALFGDALRRMLHETMPSAETELHARAAHWLTEAGLLDEASDHWISAECLPEETALLIDHGRELLLVGELPRLRRWLDRLPPDQLESVPELLFLYVAYQLVASHYVWSLAEMGQRLEQALANVRNDATISAERREQIVGELMAHLGMVALLDGKLDSAEVAFFQAREAAEQDPFLESYLFIGLGSTYRFQGKTQQAESYLQRGAAIAETHELPYFALMARLWLADIAEVEGRLSDAARLYDETLRQSSDASGTPLPIASTVLVCQAHILRERNPLAAAQATLAEALQMARLADLMAVQIDVLYTLALTQRGQGDFGAALATLDEAEALLTRVGIPNLALRTLAFRTRVALAAGDKQAIGAWHRESDVALSDPVDAELEIEFLTLVRVLLAEGRSAEIVPALRQRLAADDEVRHLATQIELTLLLAQAEAQNGDWPSAETHLLTALTLGEPERYVRLFLDEGAPMVALLRRVAQGELTPALRAYVQLLLTEAGEAAISAETTPSPLLDSLKPREIELLRLLASGLSNREIADALFLSEGTVKGYLHTLYGKLDVHRRTAAVDRARELGLL